VLFWNKLSGDFERTDMQRGEIQSPPTFAFLIKGPQGKQQGQGCNQEVEASEGSPQDTSTCSKRANCFNFI
jgi:hypothetical protein